MWGPGCQCCFSHVHVHAHTPFFYAGNLETSVLTSEIPVSFYSAMWDQPAITLLNGSVWKVGVSCVRDTERGSAEPSWRSSSRPPLCHPAGTERVCEKAFVHTRSLQAVEGLRLEIILGRHCQALQRDKKVFQRLIGRITLIGEGNSLRDGALAEHRLNTALTLAQRCCSLN